MSPERQPERKRPSKGWAKHERNRKAEERRAQALLVTSIEDRINRFALPSWERMEGIIELRMHNNSEQYVLSLKHRRVLREFYDARYAIATGGDKALYEEFIDKYGEKEKLMSDLTPHFTLIRDSIAPPRPRR